MSRMTRLTLLAAPLALAALASCSGSSQADRIAEVAEEAAESAEAAENAPEASEPELAPSVSDEPSSSSPPSPTDPDRTDSSVGGGEELQPRHWDVGKTASWGGFEVTVVSVDTAGRAEDDTITINLSFLNQTSEVRQMSNLDYSLEVDGLAYTDQSFTAPPELPAGGRNNVAPAFFVDGVFEIDAAVLIFGAPDQNQTLIPLGEGDIQSFEPQSVPVDGDLTTAATTIVVAGDAVVLASYAPGERDVFIVRIPVDISYAGDSGGGELLLPDQFALEAADGSSYLATPLVGAIDLVAEPLYPNQPPISRYLAFQIRGADPGTYTVTFTEADGTVTNATFDLEPTS